MFGGALFSPQFEREFETKIHLYCTALNLVNKSGLQIQPCPTDRVNSLDWPESYINFGQGRAGEKLGIDSTAQTHALGLEDVEVGDRDLSVRSTSSDRPSSSRENPVVGSSYWMQCGQT